MTKGFEAFAAKRSGQLEKFDTEMSSTVAKALANFDDANWYEPIVQGASVLWEEIFEQESPTGSADKAAEATFARELTDSLKKTSEPADPVSDGQINRVLYWLGAYTVNSATYAAARDAEHTSKTWVTMHDDHVRAMHREVDGQTVPLLGTFSVGGQKLHFPGEPVGPADVWINCRCLLAAHGGPEMAGKIASFAGDLGHNADEEGDGIHDSEDDEMDDTPLDDEMAMTPWHGVLVVEGVPTGDGRQFDDGSLSYADFPMPITFQRASGEGHGGSVSVGRIDNITKVGSQHRATGMFNLNVPEANEVIDGLVFGNLGGVSVDVDSNEFYVEFPETADDEDVDMMDMLFGGGGEGAVTHFTAGRIRSASIVQIPAFAEAYVALGADFDEDLRDPETGVGDADLGEGDADANTPQAASLRALTASLGGSAADLAEAYDEMAVAFADVDEGKWDGSASNYDIDQWKSACILDMGTGDENSKSRYKLPIKTPDGKLSRAGVHAAASRIGQVDAPASAVASAKSALRGAYKQLGEPAPDGLGLTDAIVASLVDFAPGTHDGPGWLTHPDDTERLRRYWTRGEGAAKIQWGIPGDFNRCRKHLGKYVNPLYLAGTCANLHKAAIGIWPGMEDGGRRKHREGLAAEPAFSLVASASNQTDNADWFKDPHFTKLTPLTVTKDGRVFGHLAAWGTCHLGIGERCIMPPSSTSNYSHFALGHVLTDEGMFSTGPIVMWTGHAGDRASAAAAARHYDNTGHAVADVRMGEDTFGPWFAGKIRDNATAADVKALRASALSGDWRRVASGDLELIAMLAVNVPGYPVQSPSFALEGTEQLSLIASGGMLRPSSARRWVTASLSVDSDDLLAIGRVVADELEYRAKRTERLSKVRDPKILEEAATARKARVAAAKSIQE